MPVELVAIYDDRTPPPAEIEAMLGRVRFSQILRRRRRASREIRETLAPFITSFRVIADDAGAEALAREIEARGDGEEGPVYLRLPSCIAPSNLSALAALAEKARYSLETMFAAPLRDDEAAMVLRARDAAAVLRAPDASARRALLLRLVETAPQMEDHCRMADLRRPRELLLYLAGATEARHFNEARSSGGTFRKSSRDVDKMRAEHAFFGVAPEALKPFLMPSFDYWEKGDRAGYSTEHLAISDAAAQLVHDAFAPEDFELLLDRFFAFISARPRVRASTAEVREGADRQIVDKLIRRLAELRALDVGRRLDLTLQASGPMGGLDAIEARALPVLRAALDRDRAGALAFSHGDPCFSNILFDRRLGLMRLIDPRGATRPEEALMHPLYDVAKFSHSVLGDYDFVNSGLCACELDDQLQLRLRLGAGAFDPGEFGTAPDAVGAASTDAGGAPAWMQAAFRARLTAEGWELQAVRAVEMSLFLSMLPLHADHPGKLAGFALIGCAILEDLERGV